MFGWCPQRLTVLLAFTCLQGCGGVYVSPAVSADSNIVVHKLDATTLHIANENVTSPRRLPAVFSQSMTHSTGTDRGVYLPDIGDAPEEPILRSKLPPDAENRPYLIGIGDVLTLIIPQTMTDTQSSEHQRESYTVQDDGAITLPALGSVVLSGKNLAEAEAALFQAFIGARIDPTFSLEVSEFNAHRVALGGAVAEPTVIAIELSPLHLNEALTRAGGVRADDQRRVLIRLYRDGQLYQIPFQQYLNEPDLQRLTLFSGDSIFVDSAHSFAQAEAYFQRQIILSQLQQQNRTQALATLAAQLDMQRSEMVDNRAKFQEQILLDAVARDYVYLTGEIGTPGRFSLPFERHATLADALYAHGGIQEKTGNPAQIYVLRGDETGAVTAWNLDARNVASLVFATRMIMQPNDIIFIAEQPVTRWNRAVQQMVPSLITTGAGLAVD